MYVCARQLSNEMTTYVDIEQHADQNDVSSIVEEVRSAKKK